MSELSPLKSVFRIVSPFFRTTGFARYFVSNGTSIVQSRRVRSKRNGAGKFLARFIRDFFLGKGDLISTAAYKKRILTNYLCAVCIFVAIIYAGFTVINHQYRALISCAAFIFVPIGSLWLNHFKFYLTSRILLILSCNLGVFVAALLDPLHSGVLFLFLTVGVGAFVILGFENRRIGFAFVVFTVILFFAAIHLSTTESGYDEIASASAKFSLPFNFTIALFVTILAVYSLMTLNRVSERELARKESLAMRKNSELKKVNEELDRFVYSVSHDLRSPLSSILGLVNVALHSTRDDELKEILIMIRGRVYAQERFIREIIDYSRNARTEILAETIELKRLVIDIVDVLRYNQNGQDIDFRISITGDATICTDKVRLSVILNNLIGNAIKYHDTQQDHPFIEISYDSQRRIISVGDNGPGIEGDVLDKIFNMFYRGSERSKGSGLGLFISKENVKKLGGDIRVESTVGIGSTFHVLLGDPKQSVN